MEFAVELAGSRWDVVVVGAGTAGSTAAMHLARAGKRVLVLEARAAGAAGAQWVNAIPDWMFDQAGIEKPRARPELRARAERHVMVDPEWTHRVVLEGSPVLFVDMRPLTERVQRLAVEAGATLLHEVAVREVIVDGERTLGVRTTQGDVYGTLTVDASGLAGVVRSKVPFLRAHCPPPRSRDVCSAAQEVRHIRDVDAARAWLLSHGSPGDALGVVGLEGGYSTRLVQVDLDTREVEILTGAIAERGRVTGQGLVDAFVRAQPWVGDKIFGGSGAIPLRRPYDRLAAPGVALVGDAACQVFPAHGSGVGAGMIAARQLAEAFVQASAEGVTDEAGARYESEFHRSLGARLAAYDVFRRLSQGLSRGDVAGMLSTGLMNELTFEAGLAQEMPDLGAAAILRLGTAAARAPRLAARLAPAALRMQLVHALFQHYPRSRPLQAAWARAADHIVGA